MYSGTRRGWVGFDPRRIVWKAVNGLTQLLTVNTVAGVLCPIAECSLSHALASAFSAPDVLLFEQYCTRVLFSSRTQTKEELPFIVF